MELTRQIELSLKHYGKTIAAPLALDLAVHQSIRQFHAPAKRKHSSIKRIGIAVLIAAFVLTITAFSSPSLADRIYGSYDIVKKKIVTLSLQQYQKVAFKFMGAKEVLGTDYPAFEKLAKQLAAAKINYSDAYQNIDYDALPVEKRAEFKQLLAEIQPYFDRLNQNPTLRNVLTIEEYDTYIEAVMKRESMMAKGKVNPSDGSVKAEDLPLEYREDYTKSSQLIRGYEEKARQSAPENKAPVVAPSK
jgi:hypothetical protein